MAVGVVKPQLNVYHSLPYSISLFFLQVKPFYTDMFYLQRLAEIKQAGRKALTIRQERVRNTDKIL
jgi:hypothetical protein